ncbi:BRCT domain-containing protein [Polychytrium aggregatum]|uniref:BRCT domain-containing protein n=1 Tax=Polychytrium aggregatum TaxID=110093 RepID=UPI0022FE8B67|nr:BRCT domain-containing protein [Polychytrium aggregatum]KAI9202200.1 BRCT domain-containing protein [Polychytrium aggregatum]
MLPSSKPRKRLVLDGQTICSTGLSDEERTDLRAKSIALGAIFSPNFTEHITILVANDIGSQKYRVAVKMGVPIVTVDWIDDCMRVHSMKTASSISLEELIESHRIPFLSDTVICTTGLTADDRETIEMNVEKYGGRFSGDLSRECTHLIAESASGKKYEFAVRNNIPIVTQGWFHECINRAEVINTEPFSLAPRLARSDSDKTSVEVLLPEHGLLKAESLKVINLDAPAHSPYLELSIYAGSEFSASEMQRIRAMVHDGCGVLAQVLDGFVTHCVFMSAERVTPDERQLLQNISKSGRDIEIVELQWLEACYAAKTIVAPDSFRLALQPGASHTIASNANAPREPQPALRRSSTLSNPSSTGLTVKVSKRRDTSMSMYGNLMELDDDATVFGVANAVPNKSSLSHQYSIQLESTDSQVQENGNTDPPQIFKGMHFATQNWSPDEKRTIRSEIILSGGQFHDVVPDSQSVVYMIVPFSGSTDFKPLPNCCVVTEYWVEYCMVNNKCFPITGNILFSPCKFALPIGEFTTLRFSITCMEMADRLHAVRLARQLGAQCEEYFTNHDTHLICGTSTTTVSKKLERSATLGIPVVKYEWLLECVRQGRMVDPRPFTLSLTTGSDTAPTSSPGNTKSFEAEGPQSSMDISSGAKPSLLRAESSRGSESDIPTRDLQHVLKDVVISFSDRVMKQYHELSRMAKMMGASVLPKYSQSCTHLLYHATRISDQTVEYKYARQANKFIVSPLWLEKCAATGTRLNEDDFPYVMNANKVLPMTLSQSVKKPSPTAAAPSRTRKSNPQPVLQPEGTSESETSLLGAPDYLIGKSSESRQMPDEIKMDEGMNQVLEMLHSKTSNEKSRRPKIQRSVPSLLSAASKCPVLDENDDSTTKEDKSTGQGSITGSSAPHEGDSIVYDDPESRKVKRKLIDELSHGKRARAMTSPDARMQIDPMIKRGLNPTQHEESDAPKTPSKSSSSTQRSSTPTTRRMTRRHNVSSSGTGVPRFLMTGISQDERLRLGKILRDLGGTVMGSENWHPDCTHLILSHMARTEKCLAACASGVWMLQPKYVDACASAGEFIDEEQYEWKPTAATPMDELMLYGAGHYWRKKLQNFQHPDRPRKGAFDSWRVLLVIDSKKRDGFYRVLRAGGAEVISWEADDCNETRLAQTEPTHILSDVSRFSTAQKLAKLCRPHKAQFLDCMYVPEFLLSPESTLSTEQFVLRNRQRAPSEARPAS